MHDHQMGRPTEPRSVNKSKWRRIALSLALVATSSCSGASPTTPDDTAQFRAITSAVFANERLWLLQDDGALVNLEPNGSSIVPVNLDGKVLAICRAEDGIAALVERTDSWAIELGSSRDWDEQTTVPTNGETLIAMACGNGRESAVLVTNRRLVRVVESDVQAVSLSNTIEPPYVTATALAADNFVWLGLNNGEWGGGLARISLNDGQVSIIQSNRSGELCGGPLNTECDPVNGLAVSPWRPECVVAAIGLVHMMAHGRIVEICGGNVDRRYFKPFDPQPPRNELDNGEPASTVAFFGLASSNRELVAVGLDGIYQFDASGKARHQNLPDFRDIDGYRVSFDIPGVALVLTEVNARASLSGSVPLLAVR